ncbi:MAG: DUF1553 domain-containing protein [Verrucomicrobiae bacterium]|nr:DUF1553 domain-containing protein [Verrucomicrobiae bacterium]
MSATASISGARHVRSLLSGALGLLFLAGTAWRERAAADEAGNHWAFQPVRPVALPASASADAANRNPIDRFLLEDLARHDLALSPTASREQLIRRASFGLTGLPPTPDEVDAFVRDPAPDAWERLIDRLLASPHYGERWARHWLDLARYAESDGFEHDALRPHAWRYRDYVVASFNEDKPYDRFLQEQIAGDELWPDQPAALVATGFNLLGPDMVDSADQVQRRLNTLNDMTDTTAAVALGLTFGCARCHDHKSEPFTQRDYYSLQAFFGPAEFHRELPIPTAEEKSRHETALAEYNAATLPQQREIEEIEAPLRQRLREEKLARLSEDAQLAHRTPREKRTREQEGTVQETAPQVEVSAAEVTRALSKAETLRREVLLEELKQTPRPPALPAAMALRNPPHAAADMFVLFRGDYTQPREQVQPGFPQVLRAGVPAPEFPQAAADGGRRTALARWLTARNNPLTARVMVNRLWQHHFGTGLVATPNDFGVQGARPTHPELLDWLAAQLIRNDWHLKPLHRLIMNSAIYRQAATASREALDRDPDNALLSRRTPRRLEAEAIRDTLLAVTGEWDAHRYGPGVRDSGSARRSVYLTVKRSQLIPVLQAFDAPEPLVSQGTRPTTTVAPQALFLMNSPEARRWAAALAGLVAPLPDGSPDAGLTEAYWRALTRPPSEQELADGREFLAAQQARHSASGNADPRRAAWTDFTQVLLSLNEFIYAD